MAFQNELTKVNNEQMVLSQLLEIAEFFRSPENRSETIDDYWTFEKINSLLRSWVIPFNSDLKQASFEKVLTFLKELLSEETTQTTVPNSELLRELIEKSELAASVSDEIRQNAIAKAEKEIGEFYRKNLEKKIVEKLTQSPIPPEERTKIAEDLSFDLQKNIKNSGLPLSCQKLENTPVETPEHQKLEQQIGFSFSNLWQTAVNKTAATHNLSAGQAEYLRKLSSPAYELTKPLQTWAMINRQEEQIYQRIAEGLSPSLSLEERTMAAEEITETLVLNRVLTKARETPVHSTPEKRSRETRVEWKKAVDAFLEKRLASTETQSLTLPDKQLTEISFILDEMQKTVSDQTEKISRILSPALAPEKASLVASELIKHLPDNLSEFASPLPTSREIENAVIASIWQMVGSEIPLKPQEATGIASALTANPQIIIPLRRFYQSAPMSKVNPLQITENGKTIIQQVKEIVFKEGINLNPESDRKLTALKQNLQAAVLTQAGITPQDLETQVQVLIKSGQTENSPQVREIRAVQKLLPEFIQKAQAAGFPQKTIQNWQKQPYPAVRLFLSRFNTVLKKIGLGEKIKLPIKFAFERSAQSSIQKLYSLVFIPRQIKELTAVKFPSFFSEIGRQSLSFIGEKILPPRLVRNFGEGIASVFSGQNRAVNSFISASQRLLSSLTSVSSLATNVSGFLIAGLVGIVILIFVVLFSAGGAMVQQSDGSSEVPGPPPMVVPPQCSDPRNLSEEVICKLTQGSFPCNQSIINQASWSETNRCFDAISLPNKAILKQWFDRFTPKYASIYGVRFNYFQCLEFVLGIQEALGQDLAEHGKGTASDYVRSYPATFKPYFLNPQTGDIAVWDGDPGHIAIVLGKNDYKIIVAQANSPLNGQIDVAERQGLVGQLGGPAIYLRYQP